MIKQKTILIVEDEPMLLQNISSILELYGFKTLLAASGFEGMKQLLTNQPDLIVCDVMMEGMNGFEMIAQVRANPAIKSIPFIFLTAWADVNDKNKGMAAGAQAYLTKPFVAKELVKTINNFIN
ncbi:MAG: response regulator [Pedobacter sp.]|nr:response regulator [Chitinophagaceae bacterium]